MNYVKAMGDKSESKSGYFFELSDASCSSKQKEREDMEKLVSAFLDGGGKIEKHEIKKFIHKCAYCKTKIDLSIKTKGGEVRLFCNDNCRRLHHKRSLTYKHRGTYKERV